VELPLTLTAPLFLQPTNPYAATKAGAEFLVKSYHRSFQLPCIITRGNNVYGSHQFPEKMIPKFVNQLMRGMKITMHGTGANTRNFLYVKDVASAFDSILHQGSVGHIYNIGGTNELSNLEVAKSLIKLMGKEGQEDDILTFVEDRAFNDLRYTINSQKLHDLGWVEETSWEEGLKETVEWYKANSEVSEAKRSEAKRSEAKRASHNSRMLWTEMLLWCAGCMIWLASEPCSEN